MTSSWGELKKKGLVMQTHECPDKNLSPFLPHGLITLHNATAGSLTHTRCAGNMKDRRKGVVEIRGERRGNLYFLITDSWM